MLGTNLNIHGKELGSISLLHCLKKNLDLASTRFQILSAFKKIPLWRADLYAGFTGYVWTEATEKKKLRIQKPSADSFSVPPFPFLGMCNLLESLLKRHP